MREALRPVSEALLHWHDENSRDLPWRGERDPYRVWLSEIMLQQTRTEAASGYYRAFLHSFPDVFALADAPEDEVMKLWEGLGYYARARNLMKTARIVAHERAGRFPDTAQALRALPGIGQYTAGAIASVAFHRPEPSVDANQMRALCRLFAIEGDISRAATKKRIDECARELLDEDRPGDFNQALMGLGAIICLPRPACEKCPVSAYCQARRMGVENELPMLPEKKGRRTENRAVAIVLCSGRVLVQKRPEGGLLGGMWEFPNFLDAVTPEDVAECLKEMGLSVRFQRTLGDATHAFTHLFWNMRGYLFETNEQNGLRFVDGAGLRSIAISSALRAFREQAERILDR